MPLCSEAITPFIKLDCHTMARKRLGDDMPNPRKQAKKMTRKRLRDDIDDLCDQMEKIKFQCRWKQFGDQKIFCDTPLDNVLDEEGTWVCVENKMYEKLDDDIWCVGSECFVEITLLNSNWELSGNGGGLRYIDVKGLTVKHMEKYYPDRLTDVWREEAEYYDILAIQHTKTYDVKNLDQALASCW